MQAQENLRQQYIQNQMLKEQLAIMQEQHSAIKARPSQKQTMMHRRNMNKIQN